MKNLVFILIAIAVGFYAFATHAEQVTLTFNEAVVNGGNPGDLLEEQYASYGIHFEEHPWNLDDNPNNDVPPDGFVFDPGVWPVAAPWSGNSGGPAGDDQFAGMSDPDTTGPETGGGGLVIRFDVPQSAISFDAINTAAAAAINWFAGPEENPQQYAGNVLVIGPNTWVSKTVTFDTPITSFSIVDLASANMWGMDNLTFEGTQAPPPTFDGTGIQIVGTSSNITTNVLAGDTVEFTVNAIEMDGAPVEYRFFTRAGYGEPDWGGNKWTIVQPYGPNNTVVHTFDTPGIYFLAGHVIHPGDTWVFGYPQSGIVVEVWPAL